MRARRAGKNPLWLDPRRQRWDMSMANVLVIDGKLA
jgi:hypothetical protein